MPDDQTAPQSPQAASPVQFRWPDKLVAEPAHMLVCPNCGDAAAKPLVLAAKAEFPGQHIDTILLRCPACGCAFFDGLATLDYAGGGEVPHIAVAFYIQQAAGIAHIVRTLAHVPGGTGKRYLDIGCGFGFGLDYALNVRGWTGGGVDPSGMAKAGAAALGLPIENRYIGPADADQQYDVVMASEVLEHIPDPRGFASLLRGLVAPGGSLVLTTPSADSVHRDAPDSLLIPVLSLGSHLVLQTPDSLKRLLNDAGFAEVRIVVVGFSLTAYASDGPLELVDDDATLRGIYRDYLNRRMALSDPAGDLWLGFATRAYQEAHAVGDWPTCDTLFAGIATQVRARYGFELDDPGTLPDMEAATTPEAWLPRAPFSLAALLYFRVHQSLQTGGTIESATPMMRAANRIAAQTRVALQRMNADDPLMQIIENERLPTYLPVAEATPLSIRIKIAIRDRFPALVRTIRRMQGR